MWKLNRSKQSGAEGVQIGEENALWCYGVKSRLSVEKLQGVRSKVKGDVI